MASHRAQSAATAALATALALVVTGCAGESATLGSDDAEVTVLVESVGYAGAGDGHAADLTAAIDDLRAETRSGWIGRQDDVTGMLGELTGGRWFAAGATTPGDVATGFLDTWGERLFAVTSADLSLDDEAEPSDDGSTTVRAPQELDGVPVVDGVLVFTIGDAAGEPRLNAVRGRAFGDLDVDTTPELDASAAVRRAEQISGGTAVDEPSLVVVPDDGGRLAWQVTVTQADGAISVAPADGYYFVDAHTGDLVSTRPASAEGRTPVRLVARGSTGPARAHAVRRERRARALAPDPGSVEVTGTAPTGEQLTAYGVETDQGVLLVDTTVPTYDDATGDGGVETWDMGGSDERGDLPGRMYAEAGTTITDPEAIAAHAYSRAVYDYYAALGRASWDGQGSTLRSSIHYADNEYCNSFFNGQQMIYGNQCAPNGMPAEISELDIDTAGHEITHGVTGSSAGLIYSGQSGALNESFSDYFGNIIGDTYYGSDSDAVMEHVCEGLQETIMCLSNPDDTRSLRYLPNGTTFDDYWFALDIDAARQLSEFNITQDHGGVHTNSAIWNNALWSIRSRLAQMDDSPALESPLAQAFDKIVFHALTTQLGPTAGFLDARRAIEQSAVDAGADPVVLRVAREVFDANRICAGCAEPGSRRGEIVSNAPETEAMPTVHGDAIAWLAKGDGGLGGLATGAVGAAPKALDPSTYSTQVVFGGDALIGLQFPDGMLPGKVLRFDGGGAGGQQVGTAGESTLGIGLAGSDDGAAWIDQTAGTISYVDAAGQVTDGDLGPLRDARITALATGSGTVVLGLASGQVVTWSPGGDFADHGSMPDAVLALATYDDRVLAVDLAGNAALLDGAEPTILSESAAPFGAAMNGDYAVWTEATGALGGGAAEVAGGAQSVDTDLYLVSFATGTIYNLLDTRGQQGFPALSGDRVVWQDAAFGGDDILTATIPSGL